MTLPYEKYLRETLIDEATLQARVARTRRANLRRLRATAISWC